MCIDSVNFQKNQKNITARECRYNSLDLKAPITKDNAEALKLHNKNSADLKDNEEYLRGKHHPKIEGENDN